MRTRRNNLPISDDKLTSEYLNDFKSTTELGAKYGCSSNTIARRLKSNNITLRPPGGRLLDYPKEFFEEEYISKGKTAGQIARDIGRDHKFVTWRLAKFGIEQRPFGKSVSIGQTGLVRVPISNRKHVPKGYKRRGEWLIGTRLSEETRHKISITKKGPLNPNWKNGAKQGKYCFKFNRNLKETIRNAFNRRCLICGTSESDRKLDVHHIDYNKMQGCGHSWNLVPVCNKCHGHMGNNRWYWFSLLKSYWAIVPTRDFNVFTNYPLAMIVL